MDHSGTHARLGWLLALVTLVADQLSKNLLLYGLDFKTKLPGEAIVLTPFLNLVMAWNPGVSFGLLPAESAWGSILLFSFSLVVVGGLCFWLFRARTRLLAIGLGMVIGGAIGNAIDRGLYGAVADFFDFHAWGYHWYVFNVADVGIVCGVGVLILDSFLEPGMARRQTSQDI